MKRTWTISALSLCLCLLAATSWALLNPTTAYAATGSADCGNGYVIYCKAEDCECEDGVGCTAANAGKPAVFTGCIGPKPDGPALVTSAQ